jgi:hypothetical protein
MAKSPCKSGSRRSPKTHRCKPIKSTKRKSPKKSSKRRSTKHKSVKKSAKRRSSKKPNTPISPARHFTLNTRRKGRNGKMWKVAETAAGNLKWVQCGPAHKCVEPRAPGPFNIPKKKSELYGSGPFRYTRTYIPGNYKKPDRTEFIKYTDRYDCSSDSNEMDILYNALPQELPLYEPNLQKIIENIIRKKRLSIEPREIDCILGALALYYDRYFLQ